MIKKIVRIFFSILLLLWLLFVLVFKDDVKNCIFEVIDLWFTKVVISILPVYIVTSLIVGFPLLSTFFFKMVKRFNLFENKHAFSLFLISMICGNPTSSILIGNSFQKQTISYPQAKLLYGNCSFISFLFIMNVVDSPLSYIIILSQILTTIFIYIFNAKKTPLSFSETNPDKNESVSDLVMQIIDTAPSVLLKILSAMLFVNLFKLPFLYVSNHPVIEYFLNLLEISTGLYCVNQMLVSGFFKLILLNTLVSFNGVAIQLQVFNVLKKAKLTMAPYIKGRIANLVISTIISFGLFLLTKLFF